MINLKVLNVIIWVEFRGWVWAFSKFTTLLTFSGDNRGDARTVIVTGIVVVVFVLA